MISAGIVLASVIGALYAAARRARRCVAVHRPRALRLLDQCDELRPRVQLRGGRAICFCRYGVQQRVRVEVYGKQSIDPQYLCVACGVDAPIIALPMPGPGVSCPR